MRYLISVHCGDTSLLTDNSRKRSEKEMAALAQLLILLACVENSELPLNSAASLLSCSTGRAVKPGFCYFQCISFNERVVMLTITITVPSYVVRWFGNRGIFPGVWGQKRRQWLIIVRIDVNDRMYGLCNDTCLQWKLQVYKISFKCSQLSTHLGDNVDDVCLCGSFQMGGLEGIYWNHQLLCAGVWCDADATPLTFALFHLKALSVHFHWFGGIHVTY